jgi:hypothetical protein
VALLTQQEADLPQCDELCGPFWAAAALRAAGFAVTQEEAAVLAGSVLAPPGAPSSLPPGETGRRPTVELPVAAPGAPAGTSAHGVARAVEDLSGGRLAAVPASGAWTAANVLGLLGRVGDEVVIANVDTGAFWDDWQVGHFVAIAEVRPPLVVIADSYASRATHVHPAERGARALAGRGLLVVTERPELVRAHVEAAGLRPELWDNGSPRPR